MTLAVLLAAALAAAAAPAPAAAPRAPVIPGTPLEFKAVDGWDLHAVWEKAEDAKPTVVLLAGTGQRKEDWRGFARALHKAGYGYAALDMRGHGESRTTPSGEVITYKKLRAVKNANDYEDMTRDVEALVGQLVGQGVPEESIGVMGAEVGGSVAIKYAAVHQKVPFVIILSPGMHWQDVPVVNAIRYYKNRPILMVQAEADKVSARDTPVLFQFAKMSAGVNNSTLIVVPDQRGTRMLGNKKNPGLNDQIIAWIANPHPPEQPAVSTGTAAGVSTAAANGVSADTAAPANEEAPGAEDQPQDEPAPVQ